MAADTRGTNTHRLLRDAVASLGRDMSWHLTRAFEEGGCSCSPLREDVNALDKECERLLNELTATETFKQRERLREEIRKVDKVEHPSLDDMARLASPFFKVWLFERLTQEDPLVITSQTQVASAYAEAWVGGWRPGA